jgi:hypothetical protein
VAKDVLISSRRRMFESFWGRHLQTTIKSIFIPFKKLIFSFKVYVGDTLGDTYS